jgi:hypothetical protein
MASHPEIVDLSMNLPPEPGDPELLDRMQDGLEAVGRDLVSLLRFSAPWEFWRRQAMSFSPSRSPIRALARSRRNLGLRLVGLPMDDEGMDADAFADARKRLTPRALYLNPTLLNPTTHTISEPRRTAIIAIARRFGVPIIEDDPYGFLPTSGPPPFAALAADITWHVAGLAPGAMNSRSWSGTKARRLSQLAAASLSACTPPKP